MWFALWAGFEATGASGLGAMKEALGFKTNGRHLQMKSGRAFEGREQGHLLTHCAHGLAPWRSARKIDRSRSFKNQPDRTVPDYVGCRETGSIPVSATTYTIL